MKIGRNSEIGTSLNVFDANVEWCVVLIYATNKVGKIFLEYLKIQSFEKFRYWYEHLFH